MVHNIHINFAKFDSLIQIADYFHSEDVCKAAIAQERWGDAVVCPYCGGTHCYMTAEGRYICKDCHKHFSVLVGTIFENTKISLRKWFMAMYLISSHKKGISSCQLARDIQVTQKTAWFLLHKVRGLYGQSDATVLNGAVEMDEMYLGGRETNKHESKKTEGTQGRSTKTKTPIFGMIDREKGTVVAMKVENTQGATLLPIVEQFVESGATTYTDELNSYSGLSKKGYNHSFVSHKKREYVRSKDIHTNSIEGFWAHFKRVIFSTYHCVSKDYVQRYIDEQTYRWNTREENASYRFHDMFSKAVKSFDYNNVLSLSSVVDTEYRTFKHNVYFHWYDHKHRVA